MTCFCGDPCCPSCGPAQGYCPKCSALGLDECQCDENEARAADDKIKFLKENNCQEIDAYDPLPIEPGSLSRMVSDLVSKHLEKA